MPTTTSTVSSSLPTAFETYYTSGAEGAKGLIPQAFQLYGKGTAADFASKYVDPLKAAELYGAGRIYGLTPEQTAVQTALKGMTTPTQFTAGTTAATKAATGLEGLLGQQAATVSAPSLTQYSMTAPTNVQATAYKSPEMGAAQLQAPQMFGVKQAEQYMSPYMQQVVDAQKREAVRDAQKAQLAQNLGAARQGTYGGARQLLATTERERALGTQLGDIQARGLESAFQQAQQQFERDRAAGLQVGMANLTAEQQANVQNLAAQLQTQGLTADQALRAALANQQAGLAVGQQNLAAALQTQQLAAGQSLEAQRANQAAALQAAQQRGQAALGLGTLGQQLGQLGVAQQATDIDRLKTLGAFGELTRGIEQQKLDTRYADLMRGIYFPETQLEALSGFIRGIPMTDTTTVTTTPPPSFASQLAGMGLAGLSLYNLLK